MWDGRYSFIITIRDISIKGVSLTKKVFFENVINFLLTRITTLSDDIRLIEKSFSISIKISFSAIAFLMTTGYIVIVAFLAFEVDKSRSSIYNKSSVFRVWNSYRTWINVRIVKLYLMKLFNVVDIFKKIISYSFASSRTAM